MAGPFKFELFFELSPDLMCIAGYDGYFKKINPAVSKTLGYTLEELYLKPINDFVHPEDKEITEKVRTELTKSKPLYNFENRYVTKSGEAVWLSWTSLPIENDKLIFAVAKNVTHKKRLEADRNGLLTSLTKINKDLMQLNYTTSHDLRSPVNNILALFDLMDVSKINDQETLKLIEILHFAGGKLKQMLNNYVDLLSEMNRLEVQAETTDLQECLDQVLQSISALIVTSGTTLKADFSKAKEITFNKVYMKSVFLNLITNSIKYSRPDSFPVIQIHTEKENGRTRLIFRDNGVGFEMQKVKEEIFSLRKTFHNHSDSKGIGLYLVYNHIKSFGGDIDIESEVNKGTKFVISFKN